MKHVFVCLCTAREPSSFVRQFGRVLKRGYVISFHYHLIVIRYSYHIRREKHIQSSIHKRSSEITDSLLNGAASCFILITHQSYPEPP